MQNYQQNYQPTSQQSSAKIRVLLVFILLALVFYAGYRFALTPNASSREGTPLGSILDLISKRYVDTINAADLESKTLQSILQELDPHSVYIDAKDVTRANEGLVGNFQGIGVEFLIYKDTVRILKCIPGGPSEKAGLHAGDCILNVFSKSRKQITLMGKETTEDSVFKYLRGPESSKIEMEIYRFGAKKPEKITLERAEIPIESIDCAFFIKPYTGYIKISRFGAKTHEEFKTAFNTLKASGLNELVLDLRGNSGGYLNAATAIADEFLKEGLTIVYTQGAHQKKNTETASSGGCFETGPLYVLIDQESASASEILAGALQDQDRATLIGRRSFGKGLVQDQIELPDGSVVRLTVARYYTPTGRCIQRAYKMGESEAYEQEAIKQYMSGELYKPEPSLPKNQPAYHTPQGKTVYGGGGIMPDYWIPMDSSNRISNDVSYRELQFICTVYTRMCQNALVPDFKSSDRFIEQFKPDQTFFKVFKSYHKQAQERDLNSNLLKLCKAYIGRVAFDNNCYYTLLLKEDPMIKKIQLLQKKL